MARRLLPEDGPPAEFLWAVIGAAGNLGFTMKYFPNLNGPASLGSIFDHRLFRTLILLFAFVASSGHAQWAVTVLHPVGADNSEAIAVHASHQSGYVVIGGLSHASAWNSTAGSWVNLTPALATESIARGAFAGKQVGAALIDGNHLPSMWEGTPDSWVNLLPFGATSGQACGIRQNIQVGFCSFPDATRAGMWNGTALSWIDLHPAGCSFSSALGVSSNEQVGVADFDASGQTHSVVWRGTSASCVDLHPYWTTFVNSEGNDVEDGQQVGWVSHPDGPTHASLWSGTAESWIDLNPAWSQNSVAYGVDEGVQVGWAFLGDQPRAGLWSGSADSYFDLHGQLPTNYSHSFANAVSVTGNTVRVVGQAFNLTAGRYEAILWRFTGRGL